ncbi:TatD family hydrolase [Mucisphaera sp.]|uniref:TatD family hydrolase n=1 Tax=Mucisphaera sp. TaxID=2913024 RepID=UPI003D1299E0
MNYIDPHIHMVSRTTDDYVRMAHAGCVAITEPAFWAGFDRGSAEGFADYFHQLTHVEPQRAARYHIAHHAWLCINPKEANDLGLAREVIQLIPGFLNAPNVLGIGEIGLNKNTRNELTILEEQIGLAAEHNLPILVHTPHLEDKRKGTLLIMDAIERNGSINPQHILIDHVEEHTVDLVLDRGYWAGMTLYPDTKCTPQRAADIIETYGSERLWVNSAGDWGPCDPLSVPRFRAEMKARQHPDDLIHRITYDNPFAFLSQCTNFKTHV